MQPDLDLLIMSARVVDPASGFDGVADVATAGPTIAEFGTHIEPSRARTLIDATGQVLIPGLVDSHVHIENLTADKPSVAHRALAVAGVTTAVDFANTGSLVEHWHDTSAGLTVLGLQALPAYTDSASRQRIGADVDDALALGAVGVKILGGHYPSTPAASAAIITEADRRGSYVGFHAGSTETGSDLTGMHEIVELAEGRSVHVAHTNAYLRGTRDDPRAENASALDLLANTPSTVSESHLAHLNACYGTVRDGQLDDHVTRNCLRMRGYEPSEHGLRLALQDGFAHLHRDETGSTVTGTDALDELPEQDRPLVSFPVNLRHTAFEQACARIDAHGSVGFEGPGRFVVDAIASDGGTWRNVILDQGLLLVELGALTWLEFAAKTSLNPARMFGLERKGQITVGADADLALVNPLRREATVTIARGDVVAREGRAIGTGGLFLTTAAGASNLAAQHVPHEVIDLELGTFRSGVTPPAQASGGRPDPEQWSHP